MPMPALVSIALHQFGRNIGVSEAGKHLDAQVEKFHVDARPSFDVNGSPRKARQLRVADPALAPEVAIASAWSVSEEEAFTSLLFDC